MSVRQEQQDFDDYSKRMDRLEEYIEDVLKCTSRINEKLAEVGQIDIKIDSEGINYTPDESEASMLNPTSEDYLSSIVQTKKKRVDPILVYRRRKITAIKFLTDLESEVAENQLKAKAEARKAFIAPMNMRYGPMKTYCYKLSITFLVFIKSHFH